MNGYQKSNLLKLIKAYDFIADNPGCTVWDLCEEMMVTHKTARRILRALHADGYTSLKVGLRSQNGQYPNAYTVTDKDRPALPPVAPSGRPVKSRKVVIDQPRGLPEHKRIIKPAQQMGIQRDAWTTAFFGPAA